jgi:hypothetical protein
MPQFICKPRFNKIDLFNHPNTTFFNNSKKYIRSEEKFYLFAIEL